MSVEQKAILEVGDILFYGGLAIMAIALILTGICVAAFILSGRRLKEQLVQEYGEPLS